MCVRHAGLYGEFTVFSLAFVLCFLCAFWLQCIHGWQLYMYRGEDGLLNKPRLYSTAATR